MSTKIDLQLGVKTDTKTPGLGEKNPLSSEDSTDFRQILDEAVSSRPTTDNKDSGKKSPKIESKNVDMPLELDNVVQKSLESNRMIITTESSGSLEEFETFAAKQGLASLSLINLLENENSSRSTFNGPDQSNINLNLEKIREGADKFKQIGTDESKNLTELRSLIGDKVFDRKENVLIDDNGNKNFGDKLTLKSTGSENLPVGQKIPSKFQNEKLQLQQNSTISKVKVDASIEQSGGTKVFDKMPVDQIGLNKNIKIREADVVIKNVVLEKNNFFKKFEKASLKLDPIDLRDDFLDIFEKNNKFKSANNSSRAAMGDSFAGKLNANYQSQYIASSEYSQNSSNELKGKTDEQTNNLSRFNQFQNMTAKFADSLVNRLTSQFNRGAWRIEMEMHPRSLGKVSVQMEMVNGNLEAQFFTNQNLTRDLILESMPRLREMLENNGTNNAEVSVELKNDGNNDKKHYASEMSEEKFGKKDVETDEDKSKLPAKTEIPGRYDFLV